MRANASAGPPGANPTRILTGRSGNACANAAQLAIASLEAAEEYGLQVVADDVGYALLSTEVLPSIAQARTSLDPVDTGSCAL